ncbi:MAG: M24 family metallopeptidase [Dehalococcoidia bacterium]
MPRIFSDGEMQRRVAELREGMDREDIVCTLVISVANLVYLGGFFFAEPNGRFVAAVIPLKEEPAIITADTELGRVKDFTWIEDIRDYNDYEAPLDACVRIIVEVLGERGIHEGKIGIEKDTIPLFMVDALKKELPNFNLADISDQIERQRLVKSREEIDLTRQGADLCKIGVRAAEEAIQVGATEIEVTRAMIAAIGDEYGRRFPDFEFQPYPFYCRAGPGRNWGHAGPTSTPIERGGRVGVTACPVIMGYFHTLGRSYFLGEIPEEMRRPNEVQQEAVRQAIEAIKPGVRFSDIDILTTSIFDKAGYAGCKGMGTGHSFGLMGPWWGREKMGELRSYNDTVMQAGMITSMEPGISVPGVGGFNTVDMILVTKDGCEVLTDYPRALKSLNG